MVDVPYSVRIDQEIRDRLATLIDQSGMTAKDFVARLVETYETNQARESVAQMKELESLRHHLARIEEIYIAIVKSSQDKAQADAGRIEQLDDEVKLAKAIAHDEREKAEQIVKEAQEQVNAASALAALAKQDAEKEIASLRETLTRAEEAREQSARLATLAEKAAAAAEASADALEEQAGKAEELARRVEQLTAERNDKARDLADAQREIERLKEQAEANRVAHAQAMERALRDATKEADLAKREAVLEAQRQAMTEIGTLREQLALAREERAELAVRLAERHEEEE